MTKLGTKWPLSTQHHKAATLLAQDKTWEYTSEAVGVHINTIGNWMQRAEFRQLVTAYEQALIDELAEELNDGMREMVLLWRKMVRGEVKPDDRRLDRIGPIVSRYFIDSLAFAEDTSKKDSRPQMAVQFNVGTSQSGDA